jgi:hypothetical protein
MNTDVDSLVAKFIRFAEVDHETMLSGDYKKGNKNVRSFNQFLAAFADKKELLTCVIEIALKCNSDRARSIAATQALRLKIFIDEALSVLKEETKRGGILSIGPEYALKHWYEHGRLPD